MLVEPRQIKKLDIENCPPGTITHFHLELVSDGMGLPIRVPVIVARGHSEGPVLGITAAVHGNELNGIPVIHRLFNDLDPAELKGTIVGVPVMNVPGYLLMSRKFNDGQDLNRLMPGKANGNDAEVYAFRLMERLLHPFDYLLDLHTASFGRINSYYIRANLNDPQTRDLAMVQNAQIILHSPAPDSTVRGSLVERGVKAITLEVGDPNKFQKKLIRFGVEGLHNAVIQLGMLDGGLEPPDEQPVICKRSTWLYTDDGGILRVLPEPTEFVKKGQVIAVLRDIFGKVKTEYRCPEDGIVIGKSVHPVAQTGSRILHLGVLGAEKFGLENATDPT